MPDETFSFVHFRIRFPCCPASVSKLDEWVKFWHLAISNFLLSKIWRRRNKMWKLHIGRGGWHFPLKSDTDLLYWLQLCTKSESHNLLPRMHLCYIDKLFREIALHAIFGLSSAAYAHTATKWGRRRNMKLWLLCNVRVLEGECVLH